MDRASILTAMGLALLAGPLNAQTAAEPSALEEIMIRVDVSEHADALATELEIGDDAVPRSVEVPIEIAATACNIPLEQLEHFRAAEQHVECKAATLTPELAAAAGEQLEREKN